MLSSRSSIEKAELRLHGSLDLAEVTRLALDTAVPYLADTATVFAVERLFRAGEPMYSGAACRIAMRRLGTRLAGADQQMVQKEFPAGEVVVFDDCSPYALCVRNREPKLFSQADGPTAEHASRRGRRALSRHDSFLAVPTIAGGYANGFLALARTAASGPFTDADIAAASRVAGGAGTGIANALTLMRQRSVAETLQRSLLAASPGVPPGLEVAARCLPAAGQLAGGDWYDVIGLPGGRCGLIVGDVMGHGPEAAVMMAQLRAAAHALAQTDPEPAELLGHLDRTATTCGDPLLATCVYAVIDPAGQSCTLAAAGHLPPVLALPDGTTHVPEDLPVGQSVGLGTADYAQASIKFPSGTVIALYTDGLVETRTRPFDQGIRALRGALDRQGDLEAACDTLIASLAERYEDDVTVLLARVP